MAPIWCLVWRDGSPLEAVVVDRKQHQMRRIFLGPALDSALALLCVPAQRSRAVLRQEFVFGRRKTTGRPAQCASAELRGTTCCASRLDFTHHPCKSSAAASRDHSLTVETES